MSCVAGHGPPEGEKSRWSAALYVLCFVNVFVHPLVLSTKFLVYLWHQHHGFEGVRTKSLLVIALHCLLEVWQGKLPPELAVMSPDALGVSRYSSSCSWTLPDWSCTFLGFPFSLGSSVPGFPVQLMTQIGLHSDHVWVEKSDAPAKSLVVALATQGVHLHRGNLRVPGGPLGEGGVCFCVVIATWWSPAWHCPLQRPPCHPTMLGRSEEELMAPGHAGRALSWVAVLPPACEVTLPWQCNAI